MKKISILLFFIVTALNCLAGGNDVKLISLYPVPLKTSRLTVRVNQSGSGVSSIEVRNLIGKKIQEKQFPVGADEIIFDEMDVNPNGMYLVLAKDETGTVVEISKFIINK